MQPLPRHWATVRETVTFPETQEYTLTIHGTSDLSVEDARRDARERLAQLVAAGGPGGRSAAPSEEQAGPEAVAHRGGPVRGPRPPPSAVEQQIIDLHDRSVRPESGLRLA